MLRQAEAARGTGKHLIKTRPAQKAMMDIKRKMQLEMNTVCYSRFLAAI